MINETACFTGHRHIPPEKQDAVSALLARSIGEAYGNGYRRFMCGGALGFDTLAALQVLKYREDHTDVRLIVVIPCQNQAERWSGKDRAVYRHIAERADERIVLSPEYYQGCMQTRNRYMVDHSSLCICYLYSFHGGTAYTVRYAVFRNIGIINLAMNASQTDLKLKENPWSSMFTSLSADGNADTARLFLSRDRKVRQKHTRTSW